MEGIFNRSELLLGQDMMQYIGQQRIIIFGVGGVGSWCTESLVRNGVSHITIVDSDLVCVSNVNRQLMATTRTIGRPKVEALRERLMEINPEAEIVARQEIYDAEHAESFHLEGFDYVIDAIDSLQEKAHLLLLATSLIGAEGSRVKKVFSSMGAALRIDPTRVRAGEFWSIKGDALARALRNRFKRDGKFPRKKFWCVYSEEPAMQNRADIEALSGTTDVTQGIEAPAPETQPSNSRWDAKKAQINGSLCHITGIFGMTLAGLVMSDMQRRFMESGEK